ncbi:MAG: hypothetical protein AAFY88_28355, partial [Acidobacteriota bacterium]
MPVPKTTGLIFRTSTSINPARRQRVAISPPPHSQTPSPSSALTARIRSTASFETSSTAPSGLSTIEREKTSWYFKRYVEHLPAAGEMVLFDRSWYNRA